MKKVHSSPQLTPELAHYWLSKPALPDISSLEEVDQRSLDAHMRHAKRLTRFAPNLPYSANYYRTLAAASRTSGASDEFARAMEEKVAPFRNPLEHQGLRSWWFWTAFFWLAVCGLCVSLASRSLRLFGGLRQRANPRYIRWNPLASFSRGELAGVICLAMAVWFAAHQFILADQTHRVVENAPLELTSGAHESQAVARYLEDKPSVFARSTNVSPRAWAAFFEAERRKQFGSPYDPTLVFRDAYFIEDEHHTIDLRLVTPRDMRLWLTFSLLIALACALTLCLAEHEKSTRRISTFEEGLSALIPGTARAYGVTGPLLTLAFSQSLMIAFTLYFSHGQYIQPMDAAVANPTLHLRSFGIWTGELSTELSHAMTTSLLPATFGFLAGVILLANLLFVAVGPNPQDNTARDNPNV